MIFWLFVNFKMFLSQRCYLMYVWMHRLRSYLLVLSDYYERVFIKGIKKIAHGNGYIYAVIRVKEYWIWAHKSLFVCFSSVALDHIK